MVMNRRWYKVSCNKSAGWVTSRIFPHACVNWCTWMHAHKTALNFSIMSETPSPIGFCWLSTIVWGRQTFGLCHWPLSYLPPCAALPRMPTWSHLQGGPSPGPQVALSETGCRLFYWKQGCIMWKVSFSRQLKRLLLLSYILLITLSSVRTEMHIVIVVSKVLVKDSGRTRGGEIASLTLYSLHSPSFLLLALPPLYAHYFTPSAIQSFFFLRVRVFICHEYYNK